MGIIEKDEEDCLQYLNKLEVEEFEDIKSGYRIKLFFDKNPYFDNDCLTKEFHLGSSGDPASQSTPIQWKEGMDLAAKFAQKAAAQTEIAKQRKRPLPQLRTFFTWFCDNGDPSDDEIAEVIKDDMWPNPLQYFLVPDIEVENGDDEDDDEADGEEDIGESVVVLEEEEEELENEEGEEEEGVEDEADNERPTE